MNKNLCNQTQQAYRPEVTEQELILKAIRLKLLQDSPEWETLRDSFMVEIDELNAVAENDRKSAPERINAIERRKGIEMVLKYPAEYVDWADSYLNENGKSLESYIASLKAESL